jgi:FkbM family methyltransferase
MLIKIFKKIKNRVVKRFNVTGRIDNFTKTLFEKYGFPQKKSEIISKALLKKFVPDNSVIIDCGAHDGKDTVALANLFKNGVVHAFEPVPEIFGRLKNRVNSFKNIKFYNIALSDKNGSAKFHVSSGESDGSSSLLVPKKHYDFHPDTVFNETINVESLTLDAWASSQGVEKVDLLWLDMQGYELQMLQASNKILSTVKVIHTEVSTTELYKGIGLYSDYKIFLEKKGFIVKVEAIPKGWTMGNVLFVRK